VRCVITESARAKPERGCGTALSSLDSGPVPPDPRVRGLARGRSFRASTGGRATLTRQSVGRCMGALTFAGLLGASLTGCGGDAAAGARGVHQEPKGALAVVVGAHANAPAPLLTGAAARARDLAVSQESYFSLVVADGAPFVAEAGPLRVAGDTVGAQQEEREVNRQRVDDAVASARARTPETDLLAALRVAAESIQDHRGHRSIVVLDSGLSTTGALDFTNPDVLDAVPQELADALGLSRRLPPVTGMSVHFVGLGNTAPPQEPLDAIRRVQLQAIWTAITDTAGASHVETESAPTDDPPADRLPPVTPVAVPRGYECTGNVMTITGGRLAYWPYTSSFVDPALAEEILLPVGQQLKAGLVTALLEGTVAGVRDTGEQLMLSYLQSQAIADVWLRQDVPIQLITVVGLGSDFPGRLPEQDATGAFDPVAAEANRRITITFSAPVTC
jgi:hypothetical protein